MAVQENESGEFGVQINLGINLGISYFRQPPAAAHLCFRQTNQTPQPHLAMGRKRLIYRDLERVTRFELVTSTLARSRSTN